MSRTPPALVVLLALSATTACVSIPAMRPVVDWQEGDVVALGAAAYDTTDPAGFVEGGFAFVAVPLGPFDLAANAQIGASSSIPFLGGSASVRYRLRLLDEFELVPEFSVAYLEARLASGIREDALVSLVETSIRFRFANVVWGYVRPGVGAGASVYGFSLGSPFPAVRLAYGAEWKVKPWLQFVVEGSVSTEVGGAYLGLGVMTTL